MSSSSVSVAQGEVWSRAVYLEDSDGVAIPLTTPAMMEIRVAASRTSDLIARLDSNPAVGQGSIESDGLPRAGLILTLDTEDIEPGGYYFDFWAIRGEELKPQVLQSGKFTIRPRVTDEIVTDV